MSNIDINNEERTTMSILSWDDFEDDEQKQAAQAHQPAPVEQKKTTDSQVVDVQVETLEMPQQTVEEGI